MVVVCNMTPVVRENYRVGVPYAGDYREILNSDAAAYGGGNIGNYGGRAADPVFWNGRPFSLNLMLPPLAALMFRWEHPARGRRS